MALATTDADGAFSVAGVPPGSLRVSSFDQATLQEGRGQPAAGGRQRSPTSNIVISGGLGNVKGVVLDAFGAGVAGAQVGGGRTLVVTDATGHFTLPDVPLGRREIVAVSNALATSGRANVDITRAGRRGRGHDRARFGRHVAGTLYLVDGVTPVPGVTVYLYKLPIKDQRIEVIGAGDLRRERPLPDARDPARLRTG